MFGKYHMKADVPVRLYESLEFPNQPQSNPQELYKQLPYAAGYYLLSIFGNQFYSNFGTDCVKVFVKS